MKEFIFYKIPIESPYITRTTNEAEDLNEELAYTHRA